MSSSRAASRGKAEQGGSASAAISALSGAAGSASLPPSASAAAASPQSSLSRPRRSAAQQAQIKLMQQMFEAERPLVNSQPSDPTAAASASPAAATADPPRRGRPPKATAVNVNHSATRKRVRIVQSSSSESDEEEAEGEAEESDGGRAGPPRRGRGRSSSSAHTRKKARGAARSDSDEEDELVARPAHCEGRKSGAAASVSASRRQPQRRGCPARASSSRSDSSSDSDAEQSEGDQDEVKQEEEQEVDQPPIADEERTAAAAAAPMAGIRSQASIIDSAAAALSSSSVDPLAVMGLLDHSVMETEIGVMQLALQATDESLAALLKSQSAQDGSTFLQRLYRVFCTMYTTGITEDRARLLRLVERHGTFHATARNHAGQTLLHTICSEATYTVKHRMKDFRHWMQPRFYEQTSTNNRTPAFSDQLCTLLLEHGADFNVPDREGFIPLVGLIECVKGGLIGHRVLSDLIFKAPKKARSQRSAAAPSPAIDLNVADASGSTLLMLIFQKWDRKFYRWDSDPDPPMLAIASKLCDTPRMLAQADLFAQNVRGQCAIQQLAQTCRDVKPRRQWWPHPGSTSVPKETLMLPQRLFKSWQAARAPLLREELDPWLIPDLADICCEYLLSSPLKGNQEMSEEEQQRLFGLQPSDQKRKMGGRASGGQRHDGIMLAAGIDQPMQAAAAAVAAAAGPAASAAAADGHLTADME